METENAVPRVEDDVRIEANPRRVQFLLENRFRNAVEHSSTNPAFRTRQDAVANGGDGVTVRVGALAGGDGFYVEDDGPGIPPEECDVVFDLGHTTADDGTGFGLPIVTEIVELHRGDIAVTDSRLGSPADAGDS